MSSPKAARNHVAPILALLAEKIRERRFTQLEVQEALGWDRSQVSMLFNGTKHLHVADLLSILETIGVEPKAFFAELYGPPKVEASRAEVAEVSAVIGGLANLLVQNGVLTASELARAAAARAGRPLLPEAEAPEPEAESQP